MCKCVDIEHRGQAVIALTVAQLRSVVKKKEKITRDTLVLATLQKGMKNPRRAVITPSCLRNGKD